MADKWPLANGVWSNAANWNDGTKPGVGDDVYADGRAVTINESVTVGSIRNTLRSGGTVGGYFIPSSGVSITGDIHSGSVSCILLNSFQINVSIAGNIYAGISSAVQSQSGSFTIVGNLYGGSASSSHAVLIQGSGALLVVGDVYGGTAVNAAGIGSIHGGGSVLCNVNVTGNVYGLAWHGIFHSINSANSTTIAGDVFGSNTAANANGVNFAAGSNGDLEIDGNVNSGSQPGARGVTFSGNGSLEIVGNLNSDGSNAVAYGGIGIARIAGDMLTGASGFSPLSANRVVLDASVTRTHTYRMDDGGAIGGPLGFSTDENIPTASDVRAGVGYGAGGLVVGSCSVPIAASVLVGVPTDNTVGTAAIDAAAIRAAIGLASANLDTQLATVDSNVDAIKAKTDQLTYTIAGQVDANSLTGGSDATAANQAAILAAVDAIESGPSPEEIGEYLEREDGLIQSIKNIFVGIDKIVKWLRQ